MHAPTAFYHDARNGVVCTSHAMNNQRSCVNSLQRNSAWIAYPFPIDIIIYCGVYCHVYHMYICVLYHRPWSVFQINWQIILLRNTGIKTFRCVTNNKYDYQSSLLVWFIYVRWVYNWKTKLHDLYSCCEKLFASVKWYGNRLQITAAMLDILMDMLSFLKASSSLSSKTNDYKALTFCLNLVPWDE